MTVILIIKSLQTLLTDILGQRNLGVLTLLLPSLFFSRL